jgi:hypothetical protein
MLGAKMDPGMKPQYNAPLSLAQPPDNNHRFTDLFQNNNANPNSNKKAVQFDIGGKPFYAKLHLIHVEKRNTANDPWTFVGQFPFALECAQPPNGAAHEPTLLTSGIERIDANCAELTIGSLTFQVVTMDDIPGP